MPGCIAYLTPTQTPSFLIPHISSFSLHPQLIKLIIIIFIQHNKPFILINIILNMCLGSNTQSLQAHKLHFFPTRPKRTIRVRVLRLSRRDRRDNIGKLEKNKMELKNLKLYMENMSILRENEKLRQKANLLHQERLALMSEFQNRFPTN